MSETQEPTVILAGIRDNLLKPMAREIEESQKTGDLATRQKLEELEHKLDKCIAMLPQGLESKKNNLSFRFVIFLSVVNFLVALVVLYSVFH